MNPLVLASSSPYRKALLSRLQLPFSTFSPNVDESRLDSESLETMVLRLAVDKAKAAAIHYPQGICIGSDEIAVLNNISLGKPGNHENARAQLMQLSGQKVDFYTSVCVYAPYAGLEDCRLVITSVTFRPLTALMIENYLVKEKPYASAGSFKSETLGSALIERFEGDDPTAMIGLPLITLCEMLRNIGVEVI